jgi:Glyoxalase/Bleomycin resistance protein/Dioxygenase superfamily
MQKYSFGARDNSIIQFAYTVDDIQEGMRRYTDLLSIGPWFLIGPFVPAKGVYRGAVTTMRISLAVAFSGEAMVELIEQHNETPSVYQETLKARGAHGFHHWAIGARDFDDTLARFKRQGYPVAFSDISPRGVRVVYFDTTRDLPGMLEIIEMTTDVEEQYRRMYQAAKDWDGRYAVIESCSQRKLPNRRKLFARVATPNLLRTHETCVETSRRNSRQFTRTKAATIANCRAQPQPVEPLQRT